MSYCRTLIAKMTGNNSTITEGLDGCHFFIHLSDQQLGAAISSISQQQDKLVYHVMTWAKDCSNKMGASLRNDAEYYLYVRKPPPSIVAGNIDSKDPRRYICFTAHSPMIC